MDLAAKEALELQPTSPQGKALLARSLLDTTAARQSIAGAKAQAWASASPTSSWAQVTLDTMQGSMSTLMCEELIGFAKNSRKQRGATIFRKPEVSMAMMLGNEVPSKRFRYMMTDDSAAPPSKRPKLLPEAFGRGAIECELKFLGLVSTAQKPPWFSPSASQIDLLV